MTQQFLQLFSFHRFRQTVGHKAFQTRFFPIKEKLTFRLVGKIIFRTRAIWVGIFWQKMEWKKKKTFDTQPLLPDTIFLPTLHGCLYLWKNPWRPLQLKVCSAQKASVCISSNFMYLHILKFASVHCFCLRITMFFTGWSSKDENPVGQPHC